MRSYMASAFVYSRLETCLDLLLQQQHQVVFRGRVRSSKNNLTQILMIAYSVVVLQ
jgi:hypothetical protein